MTKLTQDHCLRPEGGNLPCEAKRFPRCGIFGWLTGRAVEGCEILSAAKTTLTQCTPAPLTKTADWRQDGSFSSNLDQDWPFSAEKVLKHCGTTPRDKDLLRISATIESLANNYEE